MYFECYCFFFHREDLEIFADHIDFLPFNALKYKICFKKSFNKEKRITKFYYTKCS